MAKYGDTFTIVLKQTHLEWGTHRYTDSRDRIYGEGYIPIPINYAVSFELYNSNETNGRDILGKNIFNCKSKDNLFVGKLKSQGCSTAGDVYAKQFSATGNLKAIGAWYATIGATIGDKIKITFISSIDVVIEKI